MKGFVKKYTRIIHIILIVLIALLEILLITKNSRVLGFGGDWFLQSVSFYEYFRDLFYDTGDIFPNLALHIGGGQNIYYLAYYGLFSPYLLLFYCLPFIRAGDYLMITGFLNIVISAILLYIFLIRNNYSKNISLFGSLLLLTSTGMVFFNFTFVMFVQYMPFFILGLLGTKKFLDTDKSMLLVISVFLIIITSYFFSIPTIICLCLYAFYYYMKINDNLKLKMVIKDGIRYVGRIILSIIMSCFLLLPVIYVVLVGRTSPVSGFDFSGLIFGIDIKYLMYNSNGLGLSSIVWFSIIYNILYMKRENKFLAISLLLVLGIPLLNVALNGFLYESGKILMPFILFAIILIVEMLNVIKKESIKKIILTFLCCILFSVILIKFDDLLHKGVFYGDLIITFIILILYKKRKKIFMVGVIGLVFAVSIYFIDQELSLFTRKEYNDLYENMNINMDDYVNKDTSSIYRTEFDTGEISVNYSDASSVFRTTIYSSTYNKIYKEMFYNTFNNNFRSSNMLITSSQENLFFERFMGVRYLFAKSDAPYGYEKIADFNNMTLYENDDVYSIGFASSNLLNYEEYDKLSFMDKLLVYQNNIIVDGVSQNSALEHEYKNVSLTSFSIKNQKGVTIEENNGHYLINSVPYGKLSLGLDKPLMNKSLVIRFDIDNKMTCDNDMFMLSMTVNGVQNVITCDYFSYYNDNTTFDYVISSNNLLEELNINFYKGIYDISNIEVYTIDNTFFDKNNTTPLDIDFDKTKGDVIEGSIDVSEDGYFMFTIPYDNGYRAYIDGKQVDIEQVVGGFIGFKISEGDHKIKLTFEAPWAKLGRIISLVGIIILIMLNIYECRQKR